MRLYLIRHGMARSAEEDPERHLNDQGIAETRRVAAFLKPLKINVDSFYHSGKARAKGTAEIIAGAVESTNGLQQRDGINPNGDVKKFAKEMLGVNGDVMVAGHNPFMTDLATYLLSGDIEPSAVTFPLSGVMCFTRDEDGNWMIEWMIGPEIISECRL